MSNPSQHEDNQLPEPANHDQPGEPVDDDLSRTYGGYMSVGFWLLMLVFVSYGAAKWYENADNPNREPVSRSVDGRFSVELEANHWGHYVATGAINGTEVTFLVDTGASTIAIPQLVADKLGLKRGTEGYASTANGTAIVYDTQVGRVSIGSLHQDNVQADIVPGMEGDVVLLGMSWLRNFELIQRGKLLTITQL